MTREGWKTVTLANAAIAGVEGCTPTPDDVRPYIALEHMAQGEPRLLGWSSAGEATSTKAVFRKGDLLFGKLRPNLHKALVAPFEGICSTDIIVIRPQREIEVGFLLHLAHSTAFRDHAVKTASGTKMPRTSWPLLGPFTFGLPPLGEQRKIAAILSSVDDTIEATQAVIDQLQVVKKAMMAGLLTRGLPGRHTRFKKTEIGEVPEEWEVVPLRACAVRVTDGTHQSPVFTETGVPFLLVRSISSGRVRWDQTNFVSEETYQQLTRGWSPAIGDVLYTAVGATYGVAVPVDFSRPFTFQRHIAHIRPSSAIRTEFLAHVLNSPVGKRQADLAAVGNAQPTVTLGSLSRFLVPIPPLQEQEDIEHALEAVSEHVTVEEDCLSGLFSVKSALMSVLLTGEVRVTPDEAAA